jgi:hypothetical protein
VAEKHGVAPGTKLLKHDFILITDKEGLELREKEAWKEANRQGKLKVENGLLVPTEEK